MSRTTWRDKLLFCFSSAPPPVKCRAKAAAQRTKEKIHGIPTNEIVEGQVGLLDLVPILWSYLAGPERLALRACCRKSQSVHDMLSTKSQKLSKVSQSADVNRIYFFYPLRKGMNGDGTRKAAEYSFACAAIPMRHRDLPKSTPRCRPWQQPQRVSCAGLHSWGQHKASTTNSFFIRYPAGPAIDVTHRLAVVQAIADADASKELAVVHLCGVPLTSQMSRALQMLLAVAPADAPPQPLPQPPPIKAPSVPLLAATSYASSAGGGGGGIAATSAPLPISSTPTPRTLTTVTPPPPALPLRLNLYGYDLTRQPAAVALEMLVATAAPRLMRLELWGCVGWPKRMSTLFHTCSHLSHLTVSLHQLLPSSAGPHSHAGAGSCNAVVATGAVASVSPLAAAVTAAGIVKSIGGLHHLHSLELRGCTFNMCRRTSHDIGGRGGVSRPMSGASSKAAAERAAVVAAAPSVQQLATALYNLTGLKRLAISGLQSATPLLTVIAAMRGLRRLELPDAAAPAVADLAAITRAVPQLMDLTLGSVGSASAIDGASAGIPAGAASAGPEVLPLPPALTALRIVRSRPTLRMMRSIQRTVESRAAAAAAASAAAAGGSGGAGGTRMAVVVPGIEIDMLDVEFDALQGFSRGSDGIMRSTMLPASAEALAEAIRLLAPPWPLSALSTVYGGAGAAPSSYGHSLGGFVGGGADAAPPPPVCGMAVPSCGTRGSVTSCNGGGTSSVASSTWASGSVPFSAAAAATPALLSSTSFRGGVSSGFASSFATSALSTSTRLRGTGVGVGAKGFAGSSGGGGGGFCVGGKRDVGLDIDAEPAFGHAVTRELTIHNAQGSLCPPTTLGEKTPQQLLAPAGALEALREAAAGPAVTAAGPAAEGGNVEGHPPSWPLRAPLVGHAVWISEMRPLGLVSLELYGIGMRAGDVEAVSELSTLQRLTLASGELEVDALPYLANLPELEYLELSRCTPCRVRRGGTAGVHPSTSIGFARGSVGVARVSCASSYDGDGEGRPSGKRALLQLCMTAPRLRRMLIVRCMGMVSQVESTEGPLGAEWVRQRLLAAGPRVAEGGKAPVPAPMEKERALNTRSFLGRRSCASTASSAAAAAGSAQRGAEVELGWPEIVWH
ncbi:hypothetical protein VOLCADRAFT_86037 [Volvox carteri f. nagariensis]|uniref:F-box domain-containing protein n=1 Tax=Volvox carteri f. nagariensis TaxID=3068 RepID=D8THP1_VOLCA|nr:uncharacterized protein VOLCADRAFT_86037 [Volvox carteri f. nagariensis]EFJ52748.1 hypothetical protein VOLCADRAFT_86037 [Volvox carteri f. nagariensis]|eukprot:XP_002945753.1 hypothetical protein VOLCADRAFT_86037 [Volvox carteri f. nagariensis]